MQRVKMIPVYKGRFSRGGKVPELVKLDIRQSQMLEIANAGLESIKRRLRSGHDEHDGAYESLQRRYANWKSKVLKAESNTRNFQLGRYRQKGPLYLKLKPTMDTLLGNLLVRKVSTVAAEARNSTVAARNTAGGLNRLYQRKGRVGWLLFSPKNLRELSDSATKVIGNPIPLIFKNFVVSSGGKGSK